MEEEKVVQTEEVAEEPKETPAPEPEEAAKPEEEVAVEPPKPKKTAQERIDELTKIRRAEERARKKAEQESEYWRREAEAHKPKEQPKPATDEPRLEDFDTHEDWMKSWIRWDRKTQEVQRTQAEKERELDEAYQTYEKRADRIREEYEDYDEMVEQTPYSDTMKIALWKNEHGPEVAYYLATHPKDGERILKLSPDQQLVELGRLETKLLLAKQTPKTPKAPPPINPVGMGGGGREKDPSKMSDDEWFAWDRQRKEEAIRKKLGG